jgi:CRP-like cAMP-binding protein
MHDISPCYGSDRYDKAACRSMIRCRNRKGIDNEIRYLYYLATNNQLYGAEESSLQRSQRSSRDQIPSLAGSCREMVASLHAY